MISNSMCSFRSSLSYERAVVSSRGASTCIDVFVEKHSEYASSLQGNQILISCLKKVDLLENSLESLQALDAFLGRSDCSIQYMD